MPVVDELHENGVVFDGVVPDNLSCQQAGLCFMTESAQDPLIKALIILPCANPISNLFLQNSIERSKEFATNMGSIKTFQGIMRKIQAFGNLGHAPGLSGN
jgi:hypothetical protein